MKTNKILTYTVLKNKKLNDSIYSLVLQGSTSWIKPGKFLNIEVEGSYLKKPFSVFDWDKNTLTIVYKVFGCGTKKMTTLKPRSTLKVLIDLGNSYEIKDHKNPVIVCGSCGLGSVYRLAVAFNKEKKQFSMIVGFKTKTEAFYVDKLKKICKKLFVCTDDGTLGEKGNVLEIIKKHKLEKNYYYACGSTGLIRALCQHCDSGQVSLETKFGCGFGACLGCTIQTTNGPKRICRDGPIFYSKDIIW